MSIAQVKITTESKTVRVIQRMGAMDNWDLGGAARSVAVDLSSEVLARESVAESLANAIGSGGTSGASLSDLAAEASIRASVDASLLTAIGTGGGTDFTPIISSEAARAQGAEASLSTAIFVASSTQAAADASLLALISNETSSRGVSDLALSTAISAATAAQVAADASLSTAVANAGSGVALSTEISVRAAADTSLAAMIGGGGATVAQVSSVAVLVSLETSYRVSADASLSSAISAGGGGGGAVFPTSGLTHYWGFTSDSGNQTDAVGGVVCTAVSSISATDSGRAFGRGVLALTNDSGLCPTAFPAWATLSGSTGFSISCWAICHCFDKSSGVFICSHKDMYNDDWSLISFTMSMFPPISGYTGLQFAFRTQDSAWQNVVARGVFGSWFLATVTWTPGVAVRLYINGKEKASLAIPGKTLYYRSANAFAVLHDFPMSYTSWDRYTDGQIAQLAFWNRPLTAEEVAAIYNKGEGVAYP